jgi:hypothetical protein
MRLTIQIIISSGANASTVIQAVIDLNPTGLIYFGAGSFDVSSASVKFQNNRSYFIKGSGSNLDAFDTGTIINAGTATDAKAFEIVDSGTYDWTDRIFNLESLRLKADNGYGLHCDFANHTTANGGKVSPRFTLKTLLKLQYGVNQQPLDMHCQT